ncbi:MAG TPA: efflux RND transporter periplasmic adaptor subunit [Pseudolabrys sp.]
MNKPMSPGAARAVPPAPVTLVPKSEPATPGRSHSGMRWAIGGLLALLVIVAIGIAWWLSGSNAAVRYTTAPVTRGAVTRAVTATGTVNPVLTIIVGSYVSGVIQEIHCDYNTEVKQGQVCAKIDPSPYQTVVDQNKANLGVAKAQLEKDKATLSYAQLTYDRNVRLAQTSAVSKDAVDNAKSLLDQARAQIGVDEATIAQRQAQLAAAEVNLGYTNIVSPVDGTVVSRNVTVGQTVAASFQTPTLFLIATDLTKMQVDTNVSESDIGGIKTGNQAEFTVDAFPKRAFHGEVSQVRQSPQNVQNVVTYDVVVSIDNFDGALKPGMTAATRIIIDQRSDVLRVPSQALRYSPARSVTAAKRGPTSTRGSAGAQAHVWIMRDGKPVRTAVTAGLDDDSYTEIVKGDLQAGDQIIVAEQRNAAKAALPTPRL